MKFLLMLSLFLWSALANAGYLVLNNGDKITGEFKAVQGKNVIWTTPSMGEIKIKKSDIVDAKIDKVLKLKGESTGCEWLGLEGVDVSLNCGNKPVKISFLTLDEILPFATHLEDTHSYGGKFTLVGTETAGNVESSDWLAAMNVALRRGDYRHGFGLEYTAKFVKVDAQEGEPQIPSPVIEYYHGDYGLDWFFSPQWYALFDVLAEKDEALDIQERYVTGLGSGFQWWETPRTALKLEASLLETRERFMVTQLNKDLLAETDRQFASGQLAVDFCYRFDSGVDLFNRTNFSQSFDDATDWMGSSDMGVGMPLGFGVSAELNIQYAYDNLPAAGLKKEDTRLRIGVGYTW